MAPAGGPRVRREAAAGRLPRDPPPANDDAGAAPQAVAEFAPSPAAAPAAGGHAPEAAAPVGAERARGGRRRARRGGGRWALRRARLPSAAAGGRPEGGSAMPGPAAPGAAAGPGPDPEESYDFLFKLVLIGDASVGKTCLVQRFKTGAFAERQGSTIGVDFTMKSLEIQGKRVKVSGAAARGGGSGPTPRRSGSGAGGAGGELRLISRPAPRRRGALARRCRRAPARLPEEAAAGGERCRPPGVARLRAAPAAPVPQPARPCAAAGLAGGAAGAASPNSHGGPGGTQCVC